MKSLRIFSIIKNLILILTVTTFTFLPTTKAADSISLKSDVMEKQQEAFDKAFNVSIPGPTKITLKDQGTLNLPEDYFYIPAKQASALLQAMGDETGPEFAGMIIPKDHVHWFITIDYIKSGFIKDTEAKKWNNNDLLEKIKKSTAVENAAREKLGLAPLIIAGWIETPTYNAKTHQLIWSALGKTPGEQLDSNHETINYNAYILGREGYFNLSLITSNAAIADDKIHAKNLIAAITFNPGKRYEDFNKHSDLTAEYGLTSLITGLMINQTSFTTQAIIFVLNNWQLLVIALLIIALTTKIRFRRLTKVNEY